MKLRDYFFHKKYRKDEEKSFVMWSVEKSSTLIMTILLPFVVAYMVYTFNGIDFEQIGEITCPLRLQYDLYCPACGGTRALLYLLHGQIFTSIYYNAFVPVVVIEVLFYYISNALHYFPGGKRALWGARYHLWYLYVPLAAVAVNFIIKNAALLLWGIHMIP